MRRLRIKLVFAIAVMGVATLHATQTVSLDGEWRLDYFPQPDDGAVREVAAVPSNAKTVKATVPGNCELDLVNAGILPPMEVGLNVLKLRPYEGYQWLYAKTFDAPAVDVASGARAMLVFARPPAPHHPPRRRTCRAVRARFTNLYLQVLLTAQSYDIMSAVKTNDRKAATLSLVIAGAAVFP